MCLWLTQIYRYDGNVAIEAPFLAVSLPGTSVDWNYSTVPQVGYNDRAIPYARGHVLSGSSSISMLNLCSDPPALDQDLDI